MFQIKRPEVTLTFNGNAVAVTTQHEQRVLFLTQEELVRLTAELYDLDAEPLLCGTTPETACPPNCCSGWGCRG